ncbi:MAG: tRNA pseudouridine(38-40) synthase TruA [Methanobacteriota archaeon]
MRAAFKIAYDGSAFHGFARQPNVRTVEGEVRFALGKAGIVVPGESPRLQGASRTDAGVSALGNVVAFDTAIANDDLVGRFNDAAKDVWAWAHIGVPPSFDPRRARSRWYRYYLPRRHDVRRLQEAATPFVGTHDFRAFATPDAEGASRRQVDAIDVAAGDGFVSVDVRASSFLRGMVRRIVAAILACERGDAGPGTVRAALAAGRGPDFGAVPPEPLFLMDVDVGRRFDARTDRASRERVGARFERELVSVQFWRGAAERIGASPAINY